MPVPSFANSPLELRHLHGFVAVARERHFGRAAEALGVAQPLLSMRIRSLEAMVGERLLDRRPSVSLTAAGEAFLEFSLRAIGDLEEGVSAAAKAAQGVRGRLALGYPSWILPSPVPAAINAFRLDCPEVEIQLKTLRSGQQIDAARTGRLQLGFLRDHDPGEEFVLDPLYAEQWVLAVPADDPRAKSPRARLGEFDGATMILPDTQAPSLAPQVLEMFAAAGAKPAETLETGSWLATLSFVAVGAGIALVPQSQQQLWSKGIAYLPTTGLPPTTVSSFRLRRARHPALERFVETLDRVKPLTR